MRNTVVKAYAACCAVERDSQSGSEKKERKKTHLGLLLLERPDAECADVTDRMVARCNSMRLGREASDHVSESSHRQQKQNERASGCTCHRCGASVDTAPRSGREARGRMSETECDIGGRNISSGDDYC